MTLPTLLPQWSAPAGVRAAFTLREGGVSSGAYATLNVGAHVGDTRAAVSENRRRLRSALALPSEPLWLSQVHGTAVLDADRHIPGAVPPQADAAVTRRAGTVLAIMVADCLPVLFARRDGSALAVAHAGWRGLAAGVLEATVAALGEPQALRTWLGPAIGAAHFEVGGEVREAFCDQDGAAGEAFIANERGRWQCDLLALARRRLAAAGIAAVAGGRWCTYAAPERFFSYRRSGETGRMAALLWRDPLGGDPASTAG